MTSSINLAASLVGSTTSEIGCLRKVLDSHTIQKTCSTKKHVLLKCYFGLQLSQIRAENTEAKTLLELLTTS